MRSHRPLARIWWAGAALATVLGVAAAMVILRAAAPGIAAGPAGDAAAASLAGPSTSRPRRPTTSRLDPAPAAHQPTPPAPAGLSPAPTLDGPSSPAHSGLTPLAAVDRAAAYGAARGERVAVAVLDRATDQYYGAGDDTGQFRSGSVFKVFIAIELLHSGQMADPDTERLAYKMITQSDDAAANELYFHVGGPDVVYRIQDLYGITGIDRTPNPRYWGATRITAKAMAAVYEHLAVDPVAGPWLMDAMAHATAHGSDGVGQFFGIPSATDGWRVKQGWMNRLGYASINTTGYIEHDRYIVVILTEGPARGYLADDVRIITAMAQRLLPHGRFPPA